MKQKIIITRNDETIYKGKIQNIKIKEDYIIEKSIELFDDDEPCIIHQSYVVKEYVNELLELFEKVGNQIKCSDHLDQLQFLNYKPLDDVVIELKK